MPFISIPHTLPTFSSYIIISIIPLFPVSFLPVPLLLSFTYVSSPLTCRCFPQSVSQSASHTLCFDVARDPVHEVCLNAFESYFPFCLHRLDALIPLLLSGFPSCLQSPRCLQMPLCCMMLCPRASVHDIRLHACSPLPAHGLLAWFTSA